MTWETHMQATLALCLSLSLSLSLAFLLSLTLYLVFTSVNVCARQSARWDAEAHIEIRALAIFVAQPTVCLDWAGHSYEPRGPQPWRRRPRVCALLGPGVLPRPAAS